LSGSKAVEQLKECFARLPGIGPKTSQRLTYHLLRVDAREAIQLADAIRAARESTKVCSVCFHLDDVDPCSICADTTRDRSIILVVEDPRDVGSFQEAEYDGLFHVLQGKVSSLEGIGPEDLTVAPLLTRLRGGEVREVCLATNPDLEGEATARMIASRVTEAGVTVTRLARGIPAGANITQVSQSILSDAIEGRRPMR
jgi:recombination protein RecR